MSDEITRDGITYRKMQVGEMVQEGDMMDGYLGWSAAFAGTGYLVADSSASYYRPVKMSDEINDGGAAFPIHPGVLVAGKYSGMTLRDWFAGQALQGRAHRLNSPFDHRDILASDCYAIADAMIKARKEVQNG